MKYKFRNNAGEYKVFNAKSFDLAKKQAEKYFKTKSVFFVSYVNIM